MARIYVVTRGCYSDYHIVAIYDTREAAEAMCRVLNENEGSYDSAGVEDFELNAGQDEIQAGLLPYFVRLNRSSGDVMELHRTDSDYRVFSADVGVDINKNIHTTVWASSPEAAAKIANERRRMYLAGGGK